MQTTTIAGSTNCVETKYFDTISNSCQPCAASCFSCFGPLSTQCYRPYFEIGYDGSQYYQCTSGTHCRNCLKTGYNQCFLCQQGYYLDQNNLCVTSCPSPTTIVGSLVGAICISSCPSSSPFILWNNTCVSSCDPPLVAVSTTLGSFCGSSCGQSSSFLYWNSSCLPRCPSPHYQRKENNFLYCDACQPGYYFYENGACLSSCYIQFKALTIANSIFCIFPCKYYEYLYQNATCSEDCPLPYFAVHGFWFPTL